MLFQSKRHSRTLSNSNIHLIPNQSPPRNSRPSSSNGLVLQPPRSHLGGETNTNGSLDLASATLTPSPLPLEYSTDHSLTSLTSGSSMAEPAVETLSASQLASTASSPLRTEVLESPRSQSTPKSSTSRRTPLRKAHRPTRTLGDQAPSLHSRSVKVSDEAGSRLAALPGPTPSVNPVSFPPMKVDATANSLNIPSQSPHHSAIPTPISKSSSVNSTLNWDVSISNSPLPPTPTPTPTPPVSRKTAPHPPGFQPRGVCGVLTDDFLSARRMKRDGDGDGGMKRVERTKLERRLEKLINLHFPLQPDSKEARDGLIQEKTRPGHENRRVSSIFDFQTLKNVNFNDASGLWKGVVSGGLQDTTKTEIRGWHLFQSMIFLCLITICQLLNKELLPGRMTQQ